MRQLNLIGALLLLSACATAEPTANSPAIARGQALAVRNCSGCHAVGLTGSSPAREAPRFRTLARHYRIDALEEALGEGISVGHPAMPEFQFAPTDVADLVDYLQSIQHGPAAPR